MKKLSNALDEVMASKRLLRELRLLRLLRHENLVSLTNIMLPPSTNVLLWKDVYIVSELMDTDLHYVIESGQSLTDDHVQYFTAQLLAGIAYLHRCNVVHRDLKPGNVLVDRNCKLKICDFGLARSCSRQEDRDSQQLLTMYVTTRWYRAPELLCFNVSYGASPPEPSRVAPSVQPDVAPRRPSSPRPPSCGRRRPLTLGCVGAHAMQAPPSTCGRSAA